MEKKRFLYSVFWNFKACLIKNIPLASIFLQAVLMAALVTLTIRAFYLAHSSIHFYALQGELEKEVIRCIKEQAPEFVESVKSAIQAESKTLYAIASDGIITSKEIEKIFTAIVQRVPKFKFKCPKCYP